MSEHAPANPWDRRLGFWWIAEDHPDSPAIVESPDGARTYGELAGDAHQLVHLFRSLGAGQGDPIGVLADNGNTLIEVSLASQEGGLPLHPAQHPPHRARARRDHGALGRQGARDRRALRSPARRPRHRRARVSRVLAVGHIDGVPSLAEARAAHPRTEPDRPLARAACSSTPRAPPASPRASAARSPTATSARSRTTPPSSAGRSTSDRSTARCSCRPACSTAARTATTWAVCTSATRS